jgi:hypothetical protein
MDGQQDTHDGSPKPTQRTAKYFQYPHGLQYTKCTPNNIIILTGEDDYSQDRFPAIQPVTSVKKGAGISLTWQQ